MENDNEMKVDDVVERYNNADVNDTMEDDFGDFSEAVVVEETKKKFDLSDVESLASEFFEISDAKSLQKLVVTETHSVIDENKSAHLLQRIVADSIYNKEKGMFKFVNSKIRRDFCLALEIPIESQPISRSLHSSPTILSSENEEISLTNQTDKNENLEKVIEKVSTLCKISADELKEKSALELRQIIEILGVSVKSLNQEFNGLLEINEKLEMEVEVQNRLISCLIQHAMK